MFICIQMLLAIFFSVKHANCHHWKIDYTAIRWKSSLLFNFSKRECLFNFPNTFPLFLYLRFCVIFVTFFSNCFFSLSPTLSSSCALELDLGFFSPKVFMEHQ